MPVAILLFEELDLVVHLMLVGALREEHALGLVELGFARVGHRYLGFILLSERILGIGCCLSL